MPPLSDALRPQFVRAEVTSLDKIVYLSNYQAPQLLSTDTQILVCSYVLHTSGMYWGPPLGRCCARDQLNESPQAQEPPAFGLSMVNPCLSMASTKSIEAPST